MWFTDAGDRTVMGGHGSLIVHVEDPGASNFIRPLVPRLRRSMSDVVLVAQGLALELLLPSGSDALDGSAVSAASLLDDTKPDLVIVGTAENPDGMGLQLVEAAREVGLPSVGVVDAAMNASSRFRGRSEDPLRYAPDWLLVPSPYTRSQFEQLGYESARVVVTGHPYLEWLAGTVSQADPMEWVRSRDRYREILGASGTVLTFAAESLMPPSSTGGSSRPMTRTKWALETLLDAIKESALRPVLCIRPHPKEDPLLYLPYAGDRIRIDRRSTARQAILGSDVIVSATSMMLSEAAALGVPTLAVIDEEEMASWIPSIAEGRTLVGRDVASTTAVLNSFSREAGWKQPPAASPLDAGATDRCISFIEALVPGTPEAP